MNKSKVTALVLGALLLVSCGKAGQELMSDAGLPNESILLNTLETSDIKLSDIPHIDSLSVNLVREASSDQAKVALSVNWSEDVRGTDIAEKMKNDFLKVVVYQYAVSPNTNRVVPSSKTLLLNSRSFYSTWQFPVPVHGDYTTFKYKVVYKFKDNASKKYFRKNLSLVLDATSEPTVYGVETGGNTSDIIESILDSSSQVQDPIWSVL